MMWPRNNSVPVVCPPNGFSFVEVMAALVILAISLVVLLDTQGRSMDLVGKTRDLDYAVNLARQKMTELTIQADREGVSALRDEESGQFDQEKYPDYRWTYRIVPVPAPDFAAMVGAAMGADPNAKDSGADNSALFAGPLKQIGKAWGDSIKELHVEVLWGSETRPKQFELVTHLIVPNALSQLQNVLGGITGGGLPGGTTR